MEKKLAKEKQSNSEMNDLPDSLLCHILSFLSTKDSYRSSLLSKRWRSLWLQVPVFDLDSHLFHHYDDFRFIDLDNSVLGSWIDALVKRRVRHLDFEVDSDYYELVWMPLSLYSCTTLVSLSLCHVDLCGSELASAVSLPCLKVMRLDRVRYDDDLDVLLASCHVLEKLTVIRGRFERLATLRVRSKSLKSLALGIEDFEGCLLGEEDHAVEIDAPRLELMSLRDELSRSVVIHSIAPYALVRIDVNFDGKYGIALLYQDDDDDDYDDSKRTMIRNFLSRISRVRGMEISSVTLQVIHNYSKLEQLPQFSDLSWLKACFLESFWELLPTVLCCCPNLHTLFLKFKFDKEGCPIKLSSVPPCFVSSLKYVELAAPGTTKTSSQMELARFFLRNCAVLKKLTLRGSLGDDIIKKIKKIPRRSRRCVIVTG
ncbi:F-box/FBD/LRR-repeat protein [Raphanus sativus]|nr:F-box/FBD/LRR-repeat protein [Raphanus sativus]